VSCFLNKDGWIAPVNIAIKIGVKSLRFSERLHWNCNYCTSWFQMCSG